MTAINQQRLAQELNLSQTTVSRALANHPSINSETKATVWNLAAQLGYKLTTGKKARSNKGRNSSLVIGVLIAIPKKFRGQTEISQMVLRGIAERTSSEAITLDIVYQEPSAHSLKTIQRRIRLSQWKGCILIHPMADNVVELISHTIPCVSVVENYGRNYIDSVDVDQIESIGATVRKLHHAGHQKIGFATWVYDVPTPWVYHRFGAYVENIFKLGLPMENASIINMLPSERLAPEQVCDKMIRAFQKGTTAFVCAADHQVYDLIRLLRKQKIKVPQDISLTGFDGITPPYNLDQIATVRVPYDEIGRSAFHQLMHRIEFPTAPRRHVLVDGELFGNKSIRNLNSKP